MKNYKSFSITAEPFNVEILSSALWNLQIDGINEFDDKIVAFSSAEDFDVKSISNALGEIVKVGLIESFTITEEEVENKNWNKEWEDQRDVIKISERFVIRPTFREYIPKENEIVIHLDPKMSFGTGEHETTKLIVNLLEKYVKGGERILDAGSGTAILSIAAMKLGADSAIAFDVDEWCLINGKENLELNGLESKIEVKQCEIYDITESNFDLVLANINKNVLIDIKSELTGRVRHGGILILSGLLESDEKEMVEMYENCGVKLIDRSQLNEWISLVFTKN